MKKLIIGIFTFVLLFVGQTAFASSIWNNASNDCSDIAIANYTTNNGYGTPCWTGTSINANPGDTINVRVYYHNTGSSTATNTRIKVFAPTGSSANHSFSAQILSTAPNGNLYSSNVNVTLPSSQSLTYVTTKWFPNQSTSSATLLNGQSGSEVLGSNGLSIGDIAQGWSTQGTVVVAFKVGNTQTIPTCSIDNFTANPQTINQGGSATLSWNTTGCFNVKLNNSNVAVDGYQTVTPTNTTTYTLKAYNRVGTLSATKNVTVTVNTPTPTICSIKSLSASPSSIPAGGTSTIFWDTVNCTNVKLNGVGVTSWGSKPFSNIQSNTTYTLTGTSSNGATVSDSVVVSVTSTNSSCKINSFIANPTSITSGQSSTLSWNTSNCTYTKISVGSLANSATYPATGSISFSPTVTTTYILTAYGSNGVTQTRTVTVYVNNVNPNPTYCTINNFTANPTSITSGQASTLSWNTSNCTNVSIGGANVVNSGSKTVWPKQTTTYTLTAQGPNGTTQTRTVTVYVNNVNPNPTYCTINSFTSNPTSITSGQASTLYYSTSNCLTVSIVPEGGFNLPLNGTQTVWPTQTTTYTLTALGSNGAIKIQSVTVYVNNINPTYCTINNFTATPTSITSGQASTLSWNTSNCINVTISNLSYSVPTSGSQAVWPTQTKTYILTAQGTTGAVQTNSVTVYVNQNNDDTCEIVNFDASDTSIDEGDYSILSWNTNNCDHVKITALGDVDNDGSEKVYPTSDKTYTITAYDFDGGTKTDTVRIYVDDYNNNDSDCSIDSFTASDTYIERGDDVILRWRTTDCDDVSISGIGDVDDDGSETVSPRSNTTYTLRAYGDEGNDSDSIRINVDYNNNGYYNPLPPIQIYNTNVVTTVATNVTQNSAQINGLITSSSYNNASTYFEYGTSVNLGLRTASRMTNGNGNFSEYLTNLSPRTIYYFRAVGEGQNGISRGAIEIFQTLGYQTNNNNNVQTIRQVVYQQGSTVSGSESPVVLRIENRYQTIGVGDMVDYIVFYKNISSSTLTRPMVQVFIPQGLTLINSSRGTYSEDNKTLSVPIEDLRPEDEGVIYLQARVDSLDSNLAQIVTTAVLIYTNPNGAQENAMAYVLNNPRNVNLLGASAFFGNMFGMGLIGWLLLIVLIMVIILISRTYGRRNTVTTTTQKTISQ